MPPTSSARTEELNSAIESFGLAQYAASRIRKVATESIVRAKDDAEFLNWAIDVLMANEDMAWEKDAAVLKKEDAQLGGRFDKERRRWYVPAGLSLAPFQQYLRAPEPTYIELDMSTRPAQRAELKALGAGYDAQRKRWYVPAGRDVAPFRRWLTIVT